MAVTVGRVIALYANRDAFLAEQAQLLDRLKIVEQELHAISNLIQRIALESASAEPLAPVPPPPPPGLGQPDFMENVEVGAPRYNRQRRLHSTAPQPLTDDDDDELPPMPQAPAALPPLTTQELARTHALQNEIEQQRIEQARLRTMEAMENAEGGSGALHTVRPGRTARG